jgi:hypothetical protein
MDYYSLLEKEIPDLESFTVSQLDDLIIKLRQYRAEKKERCDALRSRLYDKRTDVHPVTKT